MLTPATLTLETLKQIAEMSSPHMKAINEAVTATWPDDPADMYTVALGFHLCALLTALSDPGIRQNAVDTINWLSARRLQACEGDLSHDRHHTFDQHHARRQQLK